jgi:hypothetical protein
MYGMGGEKQGGKEREKLPFEKEKNQKIKEQGIQDVKAQVDHVISPGGLAQKVKINEIDEGYHRPIERQWLKCLCGKRLGKNRFQTVPIFDIIPFIIDQSPIIGHEIICQRFVKYQNGYRHQQNHEYHMYPLIIHLNGSFYNE